MNQFRRTTLSIAILSALSASAFPRYAKLPATVESLDKVAEPYRELYEEKDGKFTLSVEGLEDVTGLKASLAAAREDAKKERQEKVKLAERYKDIDPDRYKEMMAALEGDEESQLIKAGKLDEVFNRRTEKLKAAHQKEIEAERAKEKAALDKAAKYQGRVLENAIRAATSKAEMHKHAVDDAVLHAKSIFTVDEDGNAVKLGADGQPVLGKDGKTPYSPAEWLEERKETSPHWFLNGNSGGGAQGDKGGSGGARTIKRAVFDAMTPAEKTKTAKDPNVKIVD